MLKPDPLPLAEDQMVLLGWASFSAEKSAFVILFIGSALQAFHQCAPRRLGRIAFSVFPREGAKLSFRAGLSTVATKRHILVHQTGMNPT